MCCFRDHLFAPPRLSNSVVTPFSYLQSGFLAILPRRTLCRPRLFAGDGYCLIPKVARVSPVSLLSSLRHFCCPRSPISSAKVFEASIEGYSAPIVFFSVWGRNCGRSAALMDRGPAHTLSQARCYFFTDVFRSATLETDCLA